MVSLCHSNVWLGFVEIKRGKAGESKMLWPVMRTTSNTFVCVGKDPSQQLRVKRKERVPQNVDLPPVLPKNKKKPYAIPLKKMHRAAKTDKKLAEMGIEKHLEPPKNGLLVPDLIPVAHEVLEAWKILIKGLSQLLTVIPVYGCSHCPEVHVGPVGHHIQDCRGSGNVHRRSFHSWVKGTINDVLIPIESYHIFDPFGRRVKHETRFQYDRIPAVVELCIQAGVDLPEYPSRRRTSPIRMIGKKAIPFATSAFRFEKSCKEDSQSISNSEAGCATVDGEVPGEGLRVLLEVHVGPFGHNVKLCGEFKHQWRDGKHGWQDATADEVFLPNYVWHVRDINGPPLVGALKRFYGKAPAIVEVCVQAGAEIPERYKPMMRLDIIVPDSEEARLVA
ncbi:hypothetical protein QJS10_CPA08g01900 [Acorus calamus]|uniref:APO domain-containing protein n=1 Tax=Acorus calamus TaxID=4465 RepID=A0AAV9ECP9_ACOCL|nr:hypothetical protein QJS10_CPA08g01900 [Acorus calamus]